MSERKSGLMKTYTHLPKPNSKSHEEKENYAKEHPMKYVGCSKCGSHGKGVTLYNVEGEYYCKKHKP